MQDKRTSVFDNALIWFGAAVSLAEILTGTYFAPLGFQKGVTAILLGHLIGCTLFFFAGRIGGEVRKSSMETVKMSFGQKGSVFFALLNIFQLVGWTAIMIYDGAFAAEGALHAGTWLWCIVIGGLIIVWILIGVKNLGKLNLAAMSALFILTVILCAVIFKGNAVGTSAGESISFGAAVELSVTMPLSWLPLISDYTRTAEKPRKAAAASAVVYGIVSCWMYLIGMSAAIFTGETSIALIMVKAGMGIAGLLIIVLSTVTTTFMDAYSAGVSTESVWPKLNEKWIGIGAAVIGTIAAMVYPMDNITNFLYFIGSVFAPMIAVQIADYFILKKDTSERTFNVRNLILWAVGFVLYRILMTVDLPVGNTLPDMLITGMLCIAVEKGFSLNKKTAVENHSEI